MRLFISAVFNCNVILDRLLVLKLFFLRKSDFLYKVAFSGKNSVFWPETPLQCPIHAENLQILNPKYQK